MRHNSSAIGVSLVHLLTVELLTVRDLIEQTFYLLEIRVLFIVPLNNICKIKAKKVTRPHYLLY